MGVQTLQSWESLICLDMGETRMNSEGKKTEETSHYLESMKSTGNKVLGQY